MAGAQAASTYIRAEQRVQRQRVLACTAGQRAQPLSGGTCHACARRGSPSCGTSCPCTSWTSSGAAAGAGGRRSEVGEQRAALGARACRAAVQRGLSSRSFARPAPAPPLTFCSCSALRHFLPHFLRRGLSWRAGRSCLLGSESEPESEHDTKLQDTRLRSQAKPEACLRASVDRSMSPWPQPAHASTTLAITQPSPPHTFTHDPQSAWLN